MIEAAACGTPVIAFNRGSVPEIIEPGITGFIVEDEVAAIAATRRLPTPQTYYTRRGDALRPFLRRPFWAPQTDLLVVCDDVALPVGTYRIRPQGSAGGSNGLKSVERTLGHQHYPRLRVGTRPAGDGREVGNLVDFVLSPFDAAERREVLDLLPRLADACGVWLRDGVVAAMNKHNGPQRA